MKKEHTLVLIILSILLLCTVGCQDSQGADLQSTKTSDAYPIENLNGYPVSYPIEQVVDEPGYPISMGIVEGMVQGPSFTINKPLLGGDTSVTGQGPKNVPIKLVDVSEMGYVLATTTIKDDGTFEFTFNEALKSSHNIGIMLGDLSGTEFNESDFIYSDDYFVRPLIGILFDMVVVQ